MSVGEGEVKSSAHYGYVYALVEFSELCAGKNGSPAEITRMLASGSGAGDVKVGPSLAWTIGSVFFDASNRS